MRLLQSALEKRKFLSLDDGRAVFYPFGPFRAYVAPDSECRQRIASRFAALESFSLLGIVAEVPIVSFLHLGIATKVTVVLFLALLHWLFYAAVVRHETKGLLPLPFFLGFRFYAGKSEKKRLQRQFFQGLFCGVVIIVIFGCQWFSFVFAAPFACVSVIAALLLHASHLEDRTLS